MMSMPTIEVSSLPGLPVQTALYGSPMGEEVSYNDAIVAIMVFVYDVL